MKLTTRFIFPALLIAVCAYADSVTYNVSLDTTALLGSPAGPFSLTFALADGSGTGDGNNAATLSNFQFGSGGATGSPLLSGGAAGDLSSSVLLTDSDPFANYFIQTFTPGSALSFQLQLSTNLDSGTPDTFFFDILDNTLSPIPTMAGAPIDALALINIDGNVPSLQTFGGDTSRSPVAGGDPINIGAPQFSIAEVPEPNTLPILGGGLIALAGMRWRKRACARSKG
jgi:PEP-CTERM motif